MALACILRNAFKIDGARTVQRMKSSPLTNYAATLKSHPKQLDLSKTMSLSPAFRKISLSAPRFSAAGGSHSTLWNMERAVVIGMAGLFPAAFIAPSQTLDTLLAITVVMHQHWGLEALVIDYLRPSIVGDVLPKVAHVGLYIFSIAVLGGLFYLIYNDIGITESIKKLWTVKSAGREQALEVIDVKASKA